LGIVSGLLATVVLSARGAVKETVGTTQWTILACVAIGMLVVALLLPAILRRPWWNHRSFNLGLHVAAWIMFLGGLAWVAFVVCREVPAAKLELIVRELKDEPPLTETHRTMSGIWANADRGGLRLPQLVKILAVAEELVEDGTRLIDTATVSYGSEPLGDLAAERYRWSNVVRTVGAPCLSNEEGETNVLIILGDRSDYAYRVHTLEEIRSQLAKLLRLVNDHPASSFLRSAHDGLARLLERIHLHEPTPVEIEELNRVVNTVRKLTWKAQQSTDDLAGKVKRHRDAWQRLIESINPALRAVKNGEHAAPVDKALKFAVQTIGVHANYFRTTMPASWPMWRRKMAGYTGKMYKSPVEKLECLLPDNAADRTRVETHLTEFHAEILRQLEAEDGAEIPPRDPSPDSPDIWTWYEVHETVYRLLGLQRWDKHNATLPDGTKLMDAIRADWAVLAVRIPPRPGCENKSKAVSAAQAAALRRIKQYLRQYGDDLRARIQQAKAANFQRAGLFREPFAARPPFKDEAVRGELRQWLQALGFPAAHVDSLAATPAERTECTKEACKMAETAVDVFDQVCGEHTKPDDTQWQQAALWWLVFWGGPGKDGFNPFFEADRIRRPAKIEGLDGRPIELGGLSNTDDASLKAYTRPEMSARAGERTVRNSPTPK
jgi:hypothetical protein